ncbi:MAG: acyl-CoA dehydrogenase family protein [Acidimicrobiales bacterium]
MDFELDEDQLQLRDAAAEVLAKECPPAFLRGVIADTRDPTELWATLAGLDWPGLALPTELGGVGSSMVELAIVLEQLGYVGDPTPLLATTSQLVPVVQACGDAEQQRRFLGPVATGAITGTLALAGADGRWDPAAPPVEAGRTGEGWRLAGTAHVVVDGDRADEIAVLAGTVDGTQAFVVPATAVSIRRIPTFDPTLHVADVTFDDATVSDDRRLAGEPAHRGFERALEVAATGLAAAMVGACQRVLDMVVEYVTGREQFGVPIGSFQAVKHKAVDMYIAVERARADPARRPHHRRGGRSPNGRRLDGEGGGR